MPTKLQAIRIRDFRGIRDTELVFNCRSTAILGANGTGKSSIVDAIDFLFSGQIRRLEGQGTGTYSFGRHAPHIDGSVDTGSVEATIALGALSYRVSRSLRRPQVLEVLGDVPLPDEVSSFLASCCQSGLHLLTRREILRFILAEPSKRAQRVAALLETAAVDALRLAVQGAARDSASVSNELQRLQDAQRAAALRAVAPVADDFPGLLARLNHHRHTLGSEAIANLTDSDVLAAVAAPQVLLASPLRSAPFRNQLAESRAWILEHSGRLLDQGREYLASLRELRADRASQDALRASDLVARGLAQISGDECPLCLLKWQQDTLRALLQRRFDDAAEARAKLTAIEADRTRLQAAFAAPLHSLRMLERDLERAGLSALQPIGAYRAALEGLVERLVPEVMAEQIPSASLVRRLRDSLPTELATVSLERLLAEAAGLPMADGIQAAWDELNRASVALRELRATVERRRTSRRVAQFLSHADEAFIRARDGTLRELYDSIAGVLAQNYRMLNSADEGQFTARLDPTRAGLTLEVDFFGRGIHPPGALHSEGHQDAMGLCLFLALVERLTAGPPSIVILDDVVMSVDKGHRRSLAQFLSTTFRSTQFIITTHDRVWWQQLRTAGVVTSNQAFTIEGWTITEGPAIAQNHHTFMSEAQAAFERRNIPQAAHALRRAVEALGPELCDSLGARIRFRADANWSAGEYLNSATGRLGELLKKAKDAGRSWGQDISGVTARDEVRKEIERRRGGDNWAVNAVIHFNEWADLSPEDFQPILSVYIDYIRQFVCGECGSLLRAVDEGPEPSSLRCACGSISINLNRRQ